MVNGNGLYTNLPDNWSIVRIRELTANYRAHLQTGPFGTNLLASEYKATGTPVVAVKNIQRNRLILDTDIPRVDEETHQRLANYEIKAGDIIFGRKGAVDRCALVMPSQDGWLQGSDCIRLRFLSQDIFPEFVSLVFQLPQHIQWMTSHAIGSTMPSLNQTILSGISIPLPPLPEQRKIAEILSTWDEAIQLVEALIAALKSRKQGLMQLLLTGEVRFPGFNEPWEEVQLGDVADIIMGQSPPSEAYNSTGKGLPLIQGNADIRNRKTLPRSFTSIITKLCQVDDIIMSVRAPVGEVSRSLHDACIGRGVAAIRTTRGNTDFLYQLMIFTEVAWQRLAQGSTFTAVNSSDLKTFQLNMPFSKDEQKEISELLNLCDGEIERCDLYATRFRQQKKGLMQRLLTGEVRVSV